MRFLCAYRYYEGSDLVLKVEMQESESDIKEFAIREVAIKIATKYGISSEIIEEREIDEEGYEIKTPGILYIRKRTEHSPYKLCGV